MLELIELRKAYGPKIALDGLTMRAEAGSINAVVGPNGAGKSTLMRILAQILVQDQGQALWQGAPIASLSQRRIGYLPESGGLYPTRPVSEQLQYFVSLRRGSGARWARQRVGELAERLGVSRYLGSRPRDLSKGTIQRFALIAAIAHEPEVLLADEPFSGLDPFSFESASNLLREYAGEGATVLLSTHRMEALDELAETVCILQSGRAIKSGRLFAVRQSANMETMIRMTRLDAYDKLIARLTLEHIRTTNDFVEFNCPNTISPSTVLREAMELGPITHFQVLNERIVEIYKASITEAAAKCS